MLHLVLAICRVDVNRSRRAEGWDRTARIIGGTLIAALNWHDYASAEAILIIAGIMVAEYALGRLRRMLN
ncbi:MAG: hypothetical protein ACK4IA_15470 [Paracoccus hibiscisoli]|uniref:hypothetical protein n=1 Tax=Paracoccus hibiscisoli TaxID=2023261 RepID=UPI00391C67D7